MIKIREKIKTSDMFKNGIFLYNDKLYSIEFTDKDDLLLINHTDKTVAEIQNSLFSTYSIGVAIIRVAVNIIILITNTNSHLKEDELTNEIPIELNILHTDNAGQLLQILSTLVLIMYSKKYKDGLTHSDKTVLQTKLINKLKEYVNTLVKLNINFNISNDLQNKALIQIINSVIKAKSEEAVYFTQSIQQLRNHDEIESFPRYLLDSAISFSPAVYSDQNDVILILIKATLHHLGYSEEKYDEVLNVFKTMQTIFNIERFVDNVNARFCIQHWTKSNAVEVLSDILGSHALRFEELLFSIFDNILNSETSYIKKISELLTEENIIKDLPPELVLLQVFIIVQNLYKLLNDDSIYSRNINEVIATYKKLQNDKLYRDVYKSILTKGIDTRLVTEKVIDNTYNIKSSNFEDDYDKLAKYCIQHIIPISSVSPPLTNVTSKYILYKKLDSIMVVITFYNLYEVNAEEDSDLERMIIHIIRETQLTKVNNPISNAKILHKLKLDKVTNIDNIPIEEYYTPQLGINND